MPPLNEEKGQGREWGDAEQGLPGSQQHPALPRATAGCPGWRWTVLCHTDSVNWNKKFGIIFHKHWE